MRHTSLRSVLLAATLVASPALAQEELQPPLIVPVPTVPAGEPVPAQPLLEIGEGVETPAPTIDAIPAVWAPAPKDPQGRTAYGLYLAGRSALQQGETGTGAGYLATAQALTPEQPKVQEQAVVAALLAGDLDVVARLARGTADGSPGVTQAGALVAAVQTYVAGDARAASAALRTAPIGAPHARAGALIAPWIAADAGDWATALAEPNPTGDPLTVVFGRYNRALLLEHRRRYPEADAVLKTLAETARTAPYFRVAYGEFLERRGRRDEAIALYDAAIASGAEAPDLTAARARASARSRPPALEPFRSGVVAGLTTAAVQASREGAHEFAVVYLRLALNLQRDPEGLYRLGQTLSQADQDVAARSVLSEVPIDKPDVYAAARVALALSLAKEERLEDALAALREAAVATPTDARITLLTAQQLMQLNRAEEALALLNSPVLDTADQRSEVRFMRGAAYETLGRIPEAEAQLWAALQASPNEPQILNYLGYLWVDSGTRVPEGAALIARAYAADPQDGNIQDSLGWAQYRQGQYDVAVDTLEQAVAKEPANAEINDHLGDAYWQVGRRREAGFQWSRVLTLEPDAERRTSVEKKLVDGLVAPETVTGAAL